jgi:hypothetical protein
MPFSAAGQQPAPQGPQYMQPPPYNQYPAQGPPDAYGQPPYPGQAEGQPYYPDYGQQPPPGYTSGGDWQDKLQSIQDKVVAFYRSVNPVLLLALGTTIICIVIFVAVAFQFGWIKTGSPAPQQTGVKDTTSPRISMVQVKEGNAGGAIISWVTDEYSSSQVRYGAWPYANSLTPIQNDPTTGVNMGVLVHDVGITFLTPRTTYVYYVISIDKYGNKTESTEMQFQTAAR